MNLYFSQVNISIGSSANMLGWYFEDGQFVRNVDGNLVVLTEDWYKRNYTNRRYGCITLKQYFEDYRHKDRACNKVEKAALPQVYNYSSGVRLIKNRADYPKYNFFSFWDGLCFFDVDHIDLLGANAAEVGVKLHSALKRYSWYIATEISCGGNGLHLWGFIPTRWHSFNEYCATYAYMWDCIVRLMCDICGVSMDDMPKVIDGHNLNYVQPFFYGQRTDWINHNAFNIDDSRSINDYTDDKNYYDAVLNSVSDYIKDTVSDYYYKQVYHRNRQTNRHTNVKVSVNDDIARMNTENTLRSWHYSESEIGYNLFNGLGETAVFLWSDLAEQKCEEILQHTPSQIDIDTHMEYVRDIIRRTDDKWIFPRTDIIDILNEDYGMDIHYEKDELVVEYDHTIHLGDNDYLGCHLDELQGMIKQGINLLVSGTGTGKTEIWKQLVDNISNDAISIGSESPIIVIEPYNSIVISKYPKVNDRNKMIGSNSMRNVRADAFDFFVGSYLRFRDSDVEELAKCKYIVVDESHILTMEAFRGKVMNEFISKIKAIAEAGGTIILQTGTPTDERRIFNVTNSIRVKKSIGRKITYEMMRYVGDKGFTPQQVCSLVPSLINEGRKVYIYRSDISCKEGLAMCDILSDYKVAFYQRRKSKDDTQDNTDMEWINVEHCLGDKYDVLISSCCFGVGNDLNDECPTACIIVGNNPWQIDIQVMGRWRNSKDIKVIQVVSDDNKYAVKFTEDCDYDYLLEKDKVFLRQWYEDSQHRDNTKMINQGLVIESEDEIPMFAIMRTGNIYYGNLELKFNRLLEYEIEVQDSCFDVAKWGVINSTVAGKSFSNKDIFYQNLSTIMEAYNYDTLKTEGKVIYLESDKTLCDATKAWIQLCRVDKSLAERCCDAFGQYSNWHLAKTVADIMKSVVELDTPDSNGIDFAELNAKFECANELWFDDSNIEAVCGACGQVSAEYMIEQSEGDKRKAHKEYNDMVVAWWYAWLLGHKNKEKDDYKVQNTYIKKFRRDAVRYANAKHLLCCDGFDLNEYIKERINNIYSDETFLFFMDYNEYKNNTRDVEGVVTNDAYSTDELDNVYTKVKALINADKTQKKVLAGKVGGQKGGKKGTKVQIGGVVYDTVTDAATTLQVHRNTINKWLKQGKATRV